QSRSHLSVRATKSRVVSRLRRRALRTSPQRPHASRAVKRPTVLTVPVWSRLHRPRMPSNSPRRRLARTLSPVRWYAVAVAAAVVPSAAVRPVRVTLRRPLNKGSSRGRLSDGLFFRPLFDKNPFFSPSSCLSHRGMLYLVCQINYFCRLEGLMSD